MSVDLGTLMLVYLGVGAFLAYCATTSPNNTLDPESQRNYQRNPAWFNRLCEVFSFLGMALFWLPQFIHIAISERWPDREEARK